MTSLWRDRRHRAALIALLLGRGPPHPLRLPLRGVETSVVTSAKPRLAEVRTLVFVITIQAGGIKVYVGQACVIQVGVLQIGALEVRTAQIYAYQIGARGL